MPSRQIVAYSVVVWALTLALWFVASMGWIYLAVAFVVCLVFNKHVWFASREVNGDQGRLVAARVVYQIERRARRVNADPKLEFDEPVVWGRRLRSSSPEKSLIAPRSERLVRGANPDDPAWHP